MTYKVEDLPHGMIGVYKITFPNNKVYIGISNDIRARMQQHNGVRQDTVCDKAIKKYGKITEIDILEEFKENDREFLEEREKYWIKFFNSNQKKYGYNITAGGDVSGKPNDENPKAVFTNAQVLDIRKRRFNKERKKDVYQDYKNFSFASFENIWLGRGYPDIGKEYRILPNSKSRQEYSSEANKGLKNGRAKCSKEEILQIRHRYDSGERVCDIAKDYPYSVNTISRVAKRLTFKDVE